MLVTRFFLYRVILRRSETILSTDTNLFLRCKIFYQPIGPWPIQTGPVIYPSLLRYPIHRDFIEWTMYLRTSISSLYSISILR